MSRKRGKQRKAPVEAVPDEVLAEGSGPVHRVDQDAIATVEDVVTTDDIATTEDVVTADDVVATPESERATAEPERATAEPESDPVRVSADPEPGRTKRAGRSKRMRRPGAERAASDDAPTEATAEAAGEATAEATTSATMGDVGEGAPPLVAEPDGPADRESAVLEGADPEAAVLGGAELEGTEPERAVLDGAELEGADGEAYPPHEAAAQDDRDITAAADLSTGDDGTALGRDAAGDEAGESGDGAGDDAGDDDDAAVVFPTSAATMDAVQLKHLVEALIFASDRPLTVQRLRQLTRVGDVRRLEQALAELSEDYGDRGLVLQQVSGGYQFRTRTQFSAWVQQLIAGRPVRLSRAQLETLAIIAYRQPITRPEIDDIRGVDSTATLKLLIDRMLIRVLGKREEVGRPMLYGTTKEFLDFFSLGDLRELPTLREYSELTAESRKVMSDRLGISPDGHEGGGGNGGTDGNGNGGGDPDDGDGGSGHGGNGHGGNGHGGSGLGGNGHGGNGHGGSGLGGNGHGGNGLGGPFGSGVGMAHSDALGGTAAAEGAFVNAFASATFVAGASAAEDAFATGFASDDDVLAGASAAEDAFATPSVEPVVGVAAADGLPASVSLGDNMPAGASAADGASASGSSDDDLAIGLEDADASTSGFDDEAVIAAQDDVANALSAFWAASDAVDRSNAAAVGETDDDAPADAWFDPSIGSSLDELADIPDPDEPVDAGEAGGSDAGPPAAE